MQHEAPGNETKRSPSPAEQRLGLMFRNADLLDEALTHKSAFNEGKLGPCKDNERLEFLGDAVLALAISDYLVAKFPELDEGELSKMKAGLVSRPTLARAAKHMHLGELIRLGRGEEVTAGRTKASILANVLEAVIGAVYVDRGFDRARSFVLRVLHDELSLCEDERRAERTDDYKTRLQELCQSRFGRLPRYQTIRETGPDHDKVFEVEVNIRERWLAHGRGRSKKEAEQEAARQALERMKE